MYEYKPKEVKLNRGQKERLKGIIEREEFRQLNELVRMCDLNDSFDEIVNQIQRYLAIVEQSCLIDDGADQVGEHLLTFIEEYFQNKKPTLSQKTKTGHIILADEMLEITQGYHIHLKRNEYEKRKFRLAGLYTKGTYISTNRILYFLKVDMNSKGEPTKNGKDFAYNPMLAEQVFRFFDVPVAEYYAVYRRMGQEDILTRNFLKDNQELISLKDLYSKLISKDATTVEGRIDIIRNNIKMRYSDQMKPQEMEQLLGKVTLQYYKQEFIRRLIQINDYNLGNTSIVLTHREDSTIPDIDISPAYDLDLSFCTGNDLKDACDIPKCSNGKEDLDSFLQDAIKIKGFDEFLKSCANKIALFNNPAQEIINQAYDRTSLEYIRSNSRYKDYLEERLTKVLEFYDRRGQNR